MIVLCTHNYFSRMCARARARRRARAPDAGEDAGEVFCRARPERGLRRWRRRRTAGSDTGGHVLFFFFFSLFSVVQRVLIFLFPS